SYSPASPPARPSFPTRRSSDLPSAQAVRTGRFGSGAGSLAPALFLPDAGDAIGQLLARHAARLGREGLAPGDPLQVHVDVLGGAAHITVFCRNGAQFIHGFLTDLPRQVAHIDLPALPPAGQDGLVSL